MKIILTLVTSYWLLFTFGYAQPSISLSETSFELGNIQEGRVVEKNFIVKNEGDQELFIDAKVSCGCVKILGEKKFRISPREKRKIHFSFNSTGYEGKVTHFIYINSNDPENKFLKVPIYAFVIRTSGEILERFKLINLGMILSLGLIDGVNPCAFTVLVFFISFLTFVGYTKRKIFIVGLTFILAVSITYILLGLGLFTLLQKLEALFFISQWIKVVISVLTFILGGISLYDFFIYKKTRDFEKVKLKLPLLLKEKVQETIRQKIDIRRTPELAKDLRLLVSALSCGFFISLLEFPCTGQIYLPTLLYIFKVSPEKLRAFGYLLLYNLMFIFPLLLIFYLGLRGITSEEFANLARKHFGKVKLATATLFFLLGIFVLIVGSPILAFSFKPQRITLTVIKPKDCLTCNTEPFISNLKKILKDLEIREINYEDEEAKDYISDLRIRMLPAYFLDKRIKEMKEYSKLENFLIETEKDYLYFDPHFTGVSYFIGRKRIPKRLDLFISAKVEGLEKILETMRRLLSEVKDIDFHLHFLAKERETEEFISPGGLSEIEEYLRCVCIERYNKERFFDYLICRAKDRMSSWWQDCAEGIDLIKLKECAKGQEGKDLLRKNVQLVSELSISQAPTVLIHNQEIFGITKDTSVEEIKNFLE